MARREDGLTDKQWAFVQEYLIDLNATQAAIRAGYSEKTARDIGCENLAKPNIADAISKERARLQGEVGITPERVLAEYAKIGFSDPRKLLTEGGGIVDPQSWDDDTAGAIAGYEVVRRNTGEKDENDNPIYEYVHKYKMWDKRAALDSIGKHLGMFVEKTEDVTPPERKVADAKEIARALLAEMRESGAAT